MVRPRSATEGMSILSDREVSLCFPPLTSDHWRTSATDATCLSVWKPLITAPVSGVLINVQLHELQWAGHGCHCGGRASSSVLYGWPCYARRRQQQQHDTTGCGVRSLFCVIRRVSEMAAFLISILCTFCLKSYLGNEHTALSSIVALFHCGGRRRRSWV